MNIKESLIFYTGPVSITGMLSSVDPAALGTGQFAMLNNLSISRNKVTARWGCTRLAAAPVAGASYRGSWSGSLNGIFVKLAAFRVGSETYIYSLNAAGATWTERTTVSTRFGSDGFVDFAPFRERGFKLGGGGGDYKKQHGVLIGNGKEPSLIYCQDLTPTIHVSETPTPSDSQLVANQPTPGGWFNIHNYANCAVSGGTNFDLDNSGTSATSNELIFTFNAAHAIDAVCSCDFGATSTYYGVSEDPTYMQLYESRQFHILVEDTINDPMFEYLQIEVQDFDSNWTIVFDAVQTVNRPIYTSCGNGVYLASFDLTQFNPVLDELSGLKAFRFRAVKQATTNRTARILAFMAGGYVDAAAEEVVSYMHVVTNVESARRVCRKFGGLSCGHVGGSRDRHVTLPVSEGLFFQNYVYFPSISGLSTTYMAVFYRKDPADEDYYATGVFEIIAPLIKRDNVRADQKDYGRKAPSDFTVAPPSAAAWAASSNRIYAGCLEGDPSHVMISDDNFPLRFSSLPRDSDGDGQFDADSGTTVSFPGETVKKIVPLPGSLVGVSPVAIITDRNVWRLEGIDALSLSRPTLLSPHGTLFPQTVALHKGSLYFLDSERQPRMLAGGYDSKPLGIWRIEDLLQSGDPTRAVGVVYKEAYKLSYRAPAAAVNQHVLNYEERLDGWHLHTYSSPDWAGLLIDQVVSNSNSRLLGITDTGEVFEVEQVNKPVDDRKTGSTTDDVNISITTGEMHGDLWQSLFFGRVGLLCDKAPGRTLTVTRSDPAWAGNDGTTTGVIDCETNVNDRAWRFDQTNDSAKRPPGIKAQSCQITLSGGWTPGKHLKGMFVEVGPATRKPDVAA